MFYLHLALLQEWKLTSNQVDWYLNTKTLGRAVADSSVTLSQPWHYHPYLS